jgi:hypothetical protein
MLEIDHLLPNGVECTQAQSSLLDTKDEQCTCLQLTDLQYGGLSSAKYPRPNAKPCFLCRLVNSLITLQLFH